MKNAPARRPKSPSSARSVGARRPAGAAGEWAWHYRTLRALRDHLKVGRGDRLREPCEAMEPPSLHAQDLVDELYDRAMAELLPPIPAEAAREIDDALRRLERGVYGRCETTGRPIPQTLLRAMPWCRHAPAAATTPPPAPTRPIAPPPSHFNYS